jgi:magnesium-transporting ATPase (P-type)
MNIFNSFASRKIGWSDYKLHKDLFNNKWFFFITIAEIFMQWLIIQLPFFNNIFLTERLTFGMWLTCICFGIGAILANLLSKKIFEEKTRLTFSCTNLMKIRHKKNSTKFFFLNGV